MTFRVFRTICDGLTFDIAAVTKGTLMHTVSEKKD
jgi:hypothetical protein